jgi:hypothetical protein
MNVGLLINHTDCDRNPLKHSFKAKLELGVANSKGFVSFEPIPLLACAAQPLPQALPAHPEVNPGSRFIEEGPLLVDACDKCVGQNGHSH